MAILTLKDELICLGNALTDFNGMMKENNRVVKTTKVFMETNIYPKFKSKKS